VVEVPPDLRQSLVLQLQGDLEVMARQQLVVDQGRRASQGALVELRAVEEVPAGGLRRSGGLVMTEGPRPLQGRIHASDAVRRLRDRLEVPADDRLDPPDRGHEPGFHLLRCLRQEAGIGPQSLVELPQGPRKPQLPPDLRHAALDPRHLVEPALMDLLGRDVQAGVVADQVAIELRTAGVLPEADPVRRRLAVVAFQPGS
jgi:hypothetical protein